MIQKFRIYFKKFSEFILENYVPLLISCFLIFMLLPFPVVQASDGLFLWLPRLGYSAHQILHGNIPLWNPYSFCGRTLLADGNTNAVNPFILLFFFLKPEFAYSIEIAIIFLFLPLGIWKYLRLSGFSKTASIIGTFGYVFSGQILSWSLSHGMNLSFSLFPWILYCFKKYEKSGKSFFQLIAFLMTFLMNIGGFIQFSLIANIFILIEGLEDFSLISFYKCVKNRLFTVIMGTLSAAVIIIPTIESAIYSHRRLIPYPDMMPATPDLIFTFLFGLLHSNYYHYIGLVLLTLAIIGIKNNLKKVVYRPYFVLSLTFPIILFAIYIDIIPESFQFGVASDPFRGFFIFILSISVLAAMGTESYINSIKQKKTGFYFYLTFFITFLLCMVLPFFLPQNHSILIKIPVFNLALAIIGGTIFGLAMKNLGQKSKVFLMSCWLISLVFLNSKENIFNCFKEAVDAPIHDHSVQAVFNPYYEKFLSDIPKNGRFVNISDINIPLKFIRSYFEDFAISNNIRSIGGYGSFFPKSIFIRAFQDDLFQRPYDATTHFKNNSNLDLDVLAKYGVEFLLNESNENFAGSGWKYLKQAPGYLLTGDYCIYSMFGQISQVKMSVLFDLKEAGVDLTNFKIIKIYDKYPVLLSLYRNPKYVGRAYFIDNNGNISRGAKIISDKDSYVKISIYGKAGETLILSDSWFPGWEIYDNGKKAKGFDANGFRGYKLKSSGHHYIEWIYQPKSFLYGGLISILALSLFLVVNIWRPKLNLFKH